MSRSSFLCQHFQEKEQKREQLKQLKNLKRNEITEKLKRLQELTGNEQLAFSQADLEGEFDPQRHDQLMEVGVKARIHAQRPLFSWGWVNVN